MDENLIIKISIGGREYPVKITRGDSEREEIIRKAANKINEILMKFQQAGYKNMDEQDYLAMTAIHLAVETFENVNKEDVSPLINEIKLINYSLEEAINK